MTPLDEIRVRIGLRPSRGEPTAGSAVDRSPNRALSRSSRRFVTVSGVLGLVVASTHGFLASGLADARSGPWGAARAVVTWPSPVAQQLVAGASAFALLVIALATSGYREVSQRLRWALRAATVGASLGAGPMVLVCAVTAFVWVLIVVVGLAILIAVLSAIGSGS